MTNPNLWNQLLVWPITNLLVVFYKFCEWLNIPGPLGFAIILLTVVVRFALYPLMHAQLKSAKKMADMKPHLDVLSLKHKGDKQALQQAQLALYKEHGVNPAAGCLPTLVQFPILIALYNVFYQVLGNGNATKMMEEINAIVYNPALQLKALDVTFIGVNLGIKPSDWQKYGWWLLLVPLITALLQLYQSKLMTPKSAPKLAITEGKEGEKKSDTMADMQKQMMFITPIMFGFFAFQLPIGLSLYWNIFGLFGIIQQIQVNKGK
ncbi:MAG: YidC/Oxa1 family membrane protein insertase [Candidatus Gottesmanbacteria bacterium]